MITNYRKLPGSVTFFAANMTSRSSLRVYLVRLKLSAKAISTRILTFNLG